MFTKIGYAVSVVCSASHGNLTLSRWL